MQLTPFCLMLSCLRVSPDRSQFFRYETVSLSCEDRLNSTSWKVNRKTPAGGVRLCSSSWGTTSEGSTCTIGNIYPSDSGEYWCESVDGGKGNVVNITVTDRAVILESPTLPVSEGADMTLHCRDETNSPDHVFHFYQDGRPVGSSSTGEMIIRKVSKSDEGFYKCDMLGGGESVVSWVAVEGAFPPSSPVQPAASCSVSVFRMMCHLLVGTPYLLSTILLGLIYRDRRRAARTVTERRGGSDVVMEVVVQPSKSVGSGQETLHHLKCVLERPVH